MKTKILQEPNLYFNNGETYHDPKIGLLKYGPNGLNKNSENSITLQVGVIGTHKYITKFKAFLNELKSRIDGELNKETGHLVWTPELGDPIVPVDARPALAVRKMTQALTGLSSVPSPASG